MKDYYYIMGLKPGCSQDDIKEVYRKMSKKLHPDLNQGDVYFEKRFIDLKEAFDTLRDPVKRAIYDVHLQQYNTAGGKQMKQPYRQAPQKREERPTPTPITTPRPEPGRPVSSRPATPPRSGPARPVSTNPADRPQPFRPGSNRPSPQEAYKNGLGSRRPEAPRFPANRSATSSPVKGNRTALAVLFPLAVIIFFIVGGINIYRLVNSSDAAIASATKPSGAAITPLVKHKHKHALKSALVDRHASIQPNPVKKKSLEQATAADENSTRGIVQQPIVVKTSTVKIPAKSDSIVKPHTRGEVLYATIVHPNVTGIVQLRAYDAYNASIVASIPANSKVLVLERGQVYYRVCYDKSIGFVPKWALDEQ